MQKRGTMFTCAQGTPNTKAGPELRFGRWTLRGELSQQLAFIFGIPSLRTPTWFRRWHLYA